ncbi:hypothetical protein, partial [Frankia sp. CiP3]|uniref:hypothetical protein n=2 Tax=unclassified Frankia TaxID=2632575 RepID=UPI001EF46B6D
MRKRARSGPAALITSLLVASVAVEIAVRWQWRAWFVGTVVLAAFYAITWRQILLRRDAEGRVRRAEEQARNAASPKPTGAGIRLSGRR